MASKPQEITELSGWRQDNIRVLEDARNENHEEMMRAIQNKRLGSLNILGTTQVAEYYGISKGTAYYMMAGGIIPSSKIGGRWFTFDAVLDELDKKARELLHTGFLKRSYPRVVWRSETRGKW